MPRFARTTNLLAAVAVGAVAAAAPQVSAITGTSRASVDGAAADRAVTSSAPKWVASWVSMPQLTEPGNMPPAPFTNGELVLDNATLRQTIRPSLGGSTLRLRFSNAFGGTALPITKVAIALPAGGQAGVSAIEPGSSKTLTFGGRESTVVPVGAQVVSDPVKFKLSAATNLTVTTYLATGQASSSITSHPGSRTTSYLATGDRVGDDDLGADAVPTNHWYFISGLEVPATRKATASVVLGDSLSDGRGSTTNGNNRWPDQLLDRLKTTPGASGVAVLNQAAGGNRVLNDGLGPNALARLDRDVLAQTGVSSVIVFEGVNDIGTAPADAASQKQVGDDLIAAFDQIIVRSHAQGIKVYGGTITPFGGNTNYDDPDGLREATRQRVNSWIRSSRHFDAVIDFDKAVRDPAAPREIREDLEDPDHLHFNVAGYKVIADAVPARLLTLG